MVQLIVGNKGKGKTKHLLEKVNSSVQEVSGNIVYLDKSAKHMYELNNKVRLIDLSQYGVRSCDGFMGFIFGIISQDHDLEQMYLDNFFSLAHLEEKGEVVDPVVDSLEKIGEKFGIDFILSVGCNEGELSDAMKSKVIVSL
ncbi:MAG: twitching motility protein PilT [Lachnospiraceae bacterium]|nr:twitching motility protein PilT [Lachnospiraceae bacterium]